MFFNVYLDSKTGEYSYGFGHPSKAYARTVRDLPHPRRMCVGTIERRY